MRRCVAIDGPSGTGKSSVAKVLSKKIGIVYVDTGAMYRALGYRLNALGVDVTDEAAVNNKIEDIKVEWKYDNDTQIIIVDGEDVTSTIRTQEVGELASKIAIFKSVRKKLVDIQQNIVMEYDVVMDGRDIGTKVLPFAKYKFYLHAKPDVRAKRRMNELQQKGIECDYDTILKETIERDERDITREESPLVKADDAISIDTSNLTLDQVVGSIIKIIMNRK